MPNQMPATEQIFKNGIEKYLDSQLKNLDYHKSEEWKGYIKYTSANNYLNFSFDWNKSFEFTCLLGFDSYSDNEFPIYSLLTKLGKNDSTSELKYGNDISDQLLDWIKELSKNLNGVNLSKITPKSKVIEELTYELEIETNNYNHVLQFEQLKNIADKAWEENNYALFIDKIQHKLNDFPQSYSKKLSIAKKRNK